MHGEELVRQVIAKVEAEGLGIVGGFGMPQPIPAAAVEALRFPNGAPLPPSLKTWLAFDGSFVEWFSDLEAPAFAPSSVADAATRAFGDTPTSRKFAALGTTLSADCYLLPKGTRARRMLYTGATDSSGEMPILVLDNEEPPFVVVEYPGFDVYLASAAGIVFAPKRVFGAFGEDETYGPRMKEHVDRVLGGHPSLKFGDEGFAEEATQEVEIEGTVLLGPADKLPEGYVVIEQVVTPLGGMPLRLAAPAEAVRARKRSP